MELGERRVWFWAGRHGELEEENTEMLVADCGWEMDELGIESVKKKKKRGRRWLREDIIEIERMV